MESFIVLLTNIIGPYTPLEGRNGMDAIDYPWIMAALLILLSMWFLYRLIINFASSCSK
jgi:hypothetical protein